MKYSREIKYYPSGLISYIADVAGSCCCGLYTDYYMNGQVRYRIFYRDGDIYHGEYSMRNMDGSPSLRRTYRNGIEHGESIAYGKNNEPISHLLYINGTVYKNLLLQPLGQEDKFLLSMEYDIVWIE